MNSNSTPKVAFHLTTVDAMEEILSTGLTPRIGPRSLSMGEMEPLVYLFETISDVENAMMNWAENAFEEDAELRILEISLHGISHSKKDDQFEITVKDVICPSHIVAQYDESLHKVQACERHIRS